VSNSRERDEKRREKREENELGCVTVGCLFFVTHD
jgi:hypothetical protein